MDHTNDKKFFVIVGALGVMGLLFVAFVLTAQWQEKRQAAPSVMYNSEVEAMPKQYMTITGRIEEIDSVQRIILVRDEATSAYMTIEATSATLVMFRDQNVPFITLVKGKHVTVATQSAPGSPVFTAMRIDLSDAQTAVPPPAQF